MENTDLNAIIKELVAIFAPTTPKNTEQSANDGTRKDAFAAENGRNAADFSPQRRAPSPERKEFSPKKESSSFQKKESSPKKENPSPFPGEAPHPFARLKTPAERYGEFLFRHEQYKRKLSAPSHPTALKSAAPTAVLCEKTAQTETSRNEKTAQTESIRNEKTARTQLPKRARSAKESGAKNAYFSLPLFPE